MKLALTLLTLALLALGAYYGLRRYQHWRDQRDLRIRYAKMRRFCMIPQRGTKRFFHHP